VGRANQPTVSVCKDEDYGGGCQAADLEQDEHDVVAVQGERTDEHAAEQPHHPGATTDTRGTMFLREVDDLWQVGASIEIPIPTPPMIPNKLLPPFSILHSMCRQFAKTAAPDLPH